MFYGEAVALPAEIRHEPIQPHCSFLHVNTQQEGSVYYMSRDVVKIFVKQMYKQSKNKAISHLVKPTD